MAGEMFASEVTRKNYPDLFKLKGQLKRRGIECDALPFDQYIGPYLACLGKRPFKVWYAPPEEVELHGETEGGMPISRTEQVSKPSGSFLVEWRERGQLSTQEIYDFDAGLIRDMLG